MEKELEEYISVESEQNRYRLLLDMLGIAYWEWSENGIYSSERYKNYAISEIAGKELENSDDYNRYVHPDDTALADEYMKVDSAGEHRKNVVMRAKMKDGTYRWTEMFSLMDIDPSGKPKRIISLMRDVDEEWNNQKKRLEDALDRAEKASKAKTDFLSRMSHDMRTPLNAIMGLSSLTLDEADKPEVVRDNMAKMNSASKFLLGLVNDILDMAKIEEGSVEFKNEPYVYQDFITNMWTMFKPQCDAKGIELTFNKPVMNPEVMTDKIRLNQILFNILSNSVKYTKPGGKIEYYTQNLQLDQAEHRLKVDFIVKDTGIGMAEDYLKHIFEPFVQEDNSVTPELQGSGLGLSITKQLVELMGGTIHVESEKNIGTKVVISMEFELVLSNTEEIDMTKVVDDDQVLYAKTVLLVEDHPLNAQIARMLLERKYMNVIYAENGAVAVDKFKSSQPGTIDLILMDIRMPKMSGLEAARAIRKADREDAKTIPIVAMSANAYPEDRRKSFEAGMNEHLAKPVDPELMYETIKKIIGER